MLFNIIRWKWAEPVILTQAAMATEQTVWHGIAENSICLYTLWVYTVMVWCTLRLWAVAHYFNTDSRYWGSKPYHSIGGYHGYRYIKGKLSYIYQMNHNTCVLFSLSGFQGDRCQFGATIAQQKRAILAIVLPICLLVCLATILILLFLFFRKRK